MSYECWEGGMGLLFGLTRFNLDLQEAVWLESETEDLRTFYYGQNEAQVFHVIQFDLIHWLWATTYPNKETSLLSVCQACP